MSSQPRAAVRSCANCRSLNVRKDGGPGSSVGYLVRQPRVRTAGGEVVRFDDLLGKGFALVGRSVADLTLAEAGERIAERIGARRVSLERVELAEGELDRLFERAPGTRRSAKCPICCD